MVGNGGEREASVGSIDGGGCVFVVSEFGVLLVSQRRRCVGWFCISVGVRVWLRESEGPVCRPGEIFYFKVESRALNFN